MNAHLDTTSEWVAVYEVRDKHGQIIHDAYEVRVHAANRMNAMMLAVDHVLDKTGAHHATCKQVKPS